MKDYSGKVVVVTGGAHGIGAEIARRYAQAGAAIALFDIEAPALETMADELRTTGATVLAVHGDVADYAAVGDFADRVFESFGRVDLVFSNAGVISAGTIWEEPVEDWDWLLGVNVKGLVHTAKAFTARMSAQDFPSDIVNTASIAGLLTVENSPAYVASKFAALGLTEVLDLQLQGIGSPVRAHAVCPAVVSTDLGRCNEHRNQPEFNPADHPYLQSTDYTKRWAVVEGSLPLGMPVEDAVEVIIEGVESNTFLILTHPAYNPAIAGRVQLLLSGSHPQLVQR
ncbi:SDR family NAD(P)-dependent oxidoreductase [Changpingibacter yushuensis]|uniref:SDR family NAD(P)-dependent oxidoreductase n=1 Tax=Changpingibacter yushuensis TaxID=2758440 RepID=UPI0015F42801|nr:SDR family NAD(P)-dependent oxidoreductase [Changpingibacter yushuensis]